MTFRPPFVQEQLIAHRGASAYAPENTLAAMREAKKRGARWVEIDVKLTRDGHPVIIHDDKVDRTTNGKGLVAGLTLQDIRALDAGSWFDPSFAGEKVPTFEELIETVLELDLGLQVELKPTAGDDVETADTACAALLRHWPHARGRLFLSSFSVRSLTRAAKLMPDVPRAFAVVVPPKDPRALLAEVDAQILHCTSDLVDAEALARLNESGVEFAVATINKAEDAKRLLAGGAQTVISDYPELLA
ncbi:glycerophosphodiester phosphodiesterase family protein [Rhizobium sp.]|jgi:glycerophosphoryl diester phosphodiesterase|uniref:glycerophosphodiester phosphodiesterase family protein n=1 Tax=Rhizobium sp. TaxID=391 RepID=UPI000E7E898B|nr:glycerophosphoryl diester phosphodiesterase [Rhizobium sp.]